MHPINGPIRFNGREYANLEAMPWEERREYERLAALYRDDNRNGIPDVLEPGMRYVSDNPTAVGRARGCLRGCAWGGVLGMLLLIAGIYAGVVLLFRSSESYDIAFDRVRASAEVAEVFGEPVTAGWWVLGRISSGGGTTRVSYQMPVSGPRQKGTVFISGIDRGGEWSLTVTLNYERDGRRETIRLNE